MLKLPDHHEGRTVNGYQFVIVYRPADMPVLKLAFPDAIMIMARESTLLNGKMDRHGAETMLLAKDIFGGTIIDCKLITKKPPA